MTGSFHEPVTFFLDANVLISAAWKANAEVANIWRFEDVRLTTSLYVMDEVQRNLPIIHQVDRLRTLMRSVELLPTPDSTLPIWQTLEVLSLPEKDRPVLVSAVESRADFLITGDKKHFRQWFGMTIHGVRIEPPTHLPSLFRMRAD